MGGEARAAKCNALSSCETSRGAEAKSSIRRVLFSKPYIPGTHFFPKAHFVLLKYMALRYSRELYMLHCSFLFCSVLYTFCTLLYTTVHCSMPSSSANGVRSVFVSLLQRNYNKYELYIDNRLCYTALHVRFPVDQCAEPRVSPGLARAFVLRS